MLNIGVIKKWGKISLFRSSYYFLSVIVPILINNKINIAICNERRISAMILRCCYLIAYEN